MSSDEEYLDDLLKSFMENEDESNHLSTEKEEDSNDMAEAAEEAAPVIFDEEMEAAVEETAAMDKGFAIEDFGIEESFAEEPFIEEPFIEEAFAEEPEGSADAETVESAEDDLTGEGFSLNDFAIQEPDIDDLSMEDMQQEEENPDGNVWEPALSEPAQEEADSKESDSEEFDIVDDIGIMSLEEIDELFAAADDASNEEEVQSGHESSEDADLAEISDLLQAGNNDSVDDDMLALLESMSADMGDAGQEAEEDNAGTAVDTGSETDETETNGEVKGKKGIFAKLFGKKDKAEQITGEMQEESAVGEEEQYIGQEESRDAEAETPAPQKEKKQNIFARFMSFLTETDEDEADKLKAEHGMEPSDENKNILEELDEEDKKKKKKKVKGKKKEEQGEEGAEGDEEIVLKDSKKKKKKEKKVKAEPEELLLDTKPEKKISKKNIAIIAGLSITLTAVIVVLCSIVPGYFDKKAAREAYYESDYSKSYELLYGKKLDNSDEIIYNKSKIILELNRKLSSYHNYMSMGKEVQALDALMAGVRKYPQIYEEAEAYHVTQEVNVIYETILNILNDRYALSEAVAKVINDYEDDLLYTRKLESLVYGTPFFISEEENTTTKATVDILPEEQSLIEETEQQGQPMEENDTAQPENTGEDVREETNRISLEEELPVSTGETDGQQEEQTGAEEPAEAMEQPQSEPEQPQETPVPDTSSGSQGELIQGIRQPINVEIHGN